MENNKLKFKTKLGYGVGDLGGNLYFSIIGSYLLKFLTDVTLLGPILAGLATSVGKVWDAVTDPLVGFFSDRTKSGWGRRRPYIFVGAFLLFILMIIMFTNPDIKDQIPLFIWAVVIACFLSTAYTLINIPYGALAPEITSDFNERTVLNAYRSFFAIIGTFLALGLALPIIGLFPENESLGWTVMAAIMGFVMLISSLIVFFAIKESKSQFEKPKTKIIASYISALKNKAFLTALIPWTLHITGVTFIQAAFLYYCTYIYNDEGLFVFAMLLFLLFALFFLPVWVFVSKKIGKKATYNTGMLLLAGVIIAFFFLGEALGPVFALIVMSFAGIGFSTQYAIPYSIIPDIVEYDYSETGERREGVFYGLWTCASKIGQAAAFVISGFILYLTGYAANQTQTDLAKFGIKLLCGPIPALFFITGAVILCFYPINKTFYNEIMDKIKKKESE